MNQTPSSAGVLAPPLWRDYLTLTKPEITFLVAISALAGFVLGSQGPIDWVVLAATIVGVVLASAGGAVLNHVWERDHDARMKRTASRPLPGGRIPVRHAVLFGGGLVAAGVGLLCPLTNPLTGVLAALTVALYLLVYTPLKRVSTSNTLVGTIPGALPALGGWTAATGEFGIGGWVLFGVLLFWQIPHFFSLAWMYRNDYGRADYAMLPVVKPDGRSTIAYIGVATVLMLACSLLPLPLGLSGALYVTGAVLLGAWFVIPVVRFSRSKSNTDARRLLKATVYYIPALLLLIVLDRML